MGCDAVNEQEETDLLGQDTARPEAGKNSSVGFLSFVARGPITIPQELAIGLSPAKCQIDQVLAGIVCCRVSAPVHSSKC